MDYWTTILRQALLFLMCIGASVLFVCFGEVRPWLCGLDDFLLAYEIAALTHIKQRDGIYRVLIFYRNLWYLVSLAHFMTFNMF